MFAASPPGTAWSSRSLFCLEHQAAQNSAPFILPAVLTFLRECVAFEAPAACYSPSHPVVERVRLVTPNSPQGKNYSWVYANEFTEHVSFTAFLWRPPDSLHAQISSQAPPVRYKPSHPVSEGNRCPTPGHSQWWRKVRAQKAPPHISEAGSGEPGPSASS